MDIWNHSRISVRKFGGKEEDYYAIHKFMDSSKLFYYNARHRLLLHHLYGVELATQKFNDVITNSDHQVILVRDIAVAHCQEDLNGKIPTLHDWLLGFDNTLVPTIDPSMITNPILRDFIYYPYQKSNLKASLLITLSNFGVYLAKETLGSNVADELQKIVESLPTVDFYLKQFRYTHKWQFTPDPKELKWLRATNQ